MQQTLEEMQESVRSACRAALETPVLREAAAILPSSDACFRELCLLGGAAVQNWASDSANASDLGRCALVKAALTAVDRVPAQRVSERVKCLFLEDFRAYADPPPKWSSMFEPTTVRYSEMVKLVTFRRFPAGQFHWEPMRFPRSYLLQASPVAFARLLLSLARSGGRGPMWEVHLNDRRPNSFLILEKGANRSYYRMADSLPLQPDVKAITVGSWLYSKEVEAVSPHLMWMRQHFEENGATVADLDLAPLDSGFLLGDAKRKSLYEEGKFHPRFTVAIWPRAAVLRWASRHPELAD